MQVSEVFHGDTYDEEAAIGTSCSETNPIDIDYSEQELNIIFNSVRVGKARNDKTKEKDLPHHQPYPLREQNYASRNPPQYLAGIPPLRRGHPTLKAPRNTLVEQSISTTTIFNPVVLNNNANNNMQFEAPIMLLQSMKMDDYFEEDFSRKDVVAKLSPTPVQVRSLLVTKPRTAIRVYYFDTPDKFRDFELDTALTVDKFIHLAIEEYCSHYLDFATSKIRSDTFSLKLADFHNRHDPVMEPLPVDEEVNLFQGQTLCLIRKQELNDPRKSSLQKFQHILSENEVFEVDVPYINCSHIIQLQRGAKFQDVIERVMKLVDARQSPSQFRLVEYNTYKIFDGKTNILDIIQRKYELLKAKTKTYKDTGGEEFTNVVQHQRQQVSTNYYLFTNQAFMKRTSRDDLVVQVENGYFIKERITLSIEGCQIVERHQYTGLITKLLQSACQNNSESRYPLTILISAYSEQEDLVLVLMMRNQRVRKKYRVNEEKRKQFLSEILRLCRIFKKSLSTPFS